MMQFSTDTIPAAERFDAWRDTFAIKVARLEVMTHDVAAFHANILSYSLANVTLSKNQLGACGLNRTPSTLRDGDDAVTLVACINGRLDVRCGDEEATVAPAQAILLPHHRMSDTWIAEGTRTYALRVDRAAARQHLPSLDRYMLRATRLGDPAFAILRAYCRQLMAMPEAPSGSTAALADAQLQELMANVLTNSGPADVATEGRGPAARAARLHVIKADIAENLASDLSIAEMAARHRLPVRYLQRLFAEEGTTFTEFVLDERLARVYWWLTNSADANLKISAVATDAGFGNLSYFNQSFRRRYGASPSDVRAQALRAD
jgi:AraC-like DNA-binding protein